VVFVCRYLDLFTTYYSLYNSCMKILYIALTALTIYIMRYQAPIKSTYDPNQDTFYHLKYAVAPCLALAFITNLVQGFDLVELLWDFSIYLEALAIVPQLIVLQVSHCASSLSAQQSTVFAQYSSSSLCKCSSVYTYTLHVVQCRILSVKQATVSV
jgi:ER lumen protein retaining receptor